MKDEGGRRKRISEFAEGQRVSSLLLVERKEVLSKRDGSPYLSLALRDGTGMVEARLWEFTPDLEALAQEGRVLLVEGDVKFYNGRLQLVLSSMKPSEFSARDLRPHAPVPMEELTKGVLQMVEEVGDPDYQAVLKFFFSPRELEELVEVPGGKRVHHAYVGGLLHHLLSVARACLEMVSLYPRLDRDLLIAGALLHDIGKAKELAWEGLSIEYTDEGRFLGHVALGLEMVGNALEALEVPRLKGEKLLHIIASHHGEPDQGALKRPKIPEALVVYYMDQMDAKVSGFLSFVERDDREGNWTAYHRVFQRYIYKG
ncbi:MAG TPA: HD domain-containing protein [Thermosulfidibacter takaii]|uniref:HD domain-containing protein n=1 Tax=Thermosulfidibacter takaii TaxID=412593 RepID=A0A7C0U6V2_9BACT|nr:HD domain-containing protein [Thermosulfidibacter takaii]